MRRLIGAIVGGGIAVFAGATAMDDHTTRNDDGEIVDDGGLGVLAVKVGDCVQLPDEDLVMSVEGVPCAAPHDAQSYAEFDLRDGSYPGIVDVDADAFDGCVDRWPAALEHTWETDRVYDVFAFSPTEAGWRLGDHEVMCFVIRIDGETITGDLL